MEINHSALAFGDQFARANESPCFARAMKEHYVSECQREDGEQSALLVPWESP